MSDYGGRYDGPDVPAPIWLVDLIRELSRQPRNRIVVAT